MGEVRSSLRESFLFCFWIGWQGLAVGLQWIAGQCMVDL